MRATLPMLAVALLAGCAYGGSADSDGLESKLAEAAAVSNMFCDDSQWRTAFDGDEDATGSLQLNWTAPSTGSWDFVVEGASVTDSPGVTLALPRCDAAGELLDGALARVNSRQYPDARTSIFSFEVTERSTYRVWIDVYAPPGTAARVFVRPTPPAPPPAAPPAMTPATPPDPCSASTSCAECGSRSACGWCDGACRNGTFIGPIVGRCEMSAWAWYPSVCPSR